MNKKLFFGMFAAATMLFATSCSNDEMDGLKGNESVVSFTLEQPGISTRAYSDGLKATNLTYAVYDAEGNLVKSDELKGIFSGKQATVTFTLPPNKTYDFLFWADNENAPYTFSTTDKTITVDYKNAKGNDEDRDAFYAVKTGLEVLEGSVTETITLTRPFAQLNIGAIGNEVIGFTPAKSKVSVSGIGRVLNLVSGVVTGQEKADFEITEFPQNEAFPVEGVDNYYSMNYLLVGSVDKELVTVDFTLLDENGTENSRSFANIPVRANYRTNIYGPIGNILSNSATFTCTIEEQYETPNYSLGKVKVGNTEYETIAEALAANGSWITVELGIGEYTLPNKMELKGGATGPVTFVGQGAGTVIYGVQWPNNNAEPMHAQGLVLKFEDLTFVTNNDYISAGFGHSVTVTFEGCDIVGGFNCNTETVFRNCTIDPLGDYICTRGATNTIFEGCTFNSSEGKAIQAYTEGYDNKIYLTVKDCKFKATRVGEEKYYSGPITAIEISAIRGNQFFVNIINSTAEGYADGTVSGNSLWNWRDNSKDGNYKGTEAATVTVDGAEVFNSAN
ncbi:MULTISPECIES: hypothetical protein [Bacteroides]|uniref:hypothetical protein n=1 Tax=Bacteroides TaxID=816 RepID=UPI00319E5BBA